MPRREDSRAAIVNGVGALAATAFAARGVLRPQYIDPKRSEHSLTAFWAASSAVRTCAITVPLIVSLTTRHPSASALLVVAGAVQLGDAALGVWQRKFDMTVAPAAMGVVHLAGARSLRP